MDEINCLGKEGIQIEHRAGGTRNLGRRLDLKGALLNLVVTKRISHSEPNLPADI
jgi:hypothetical protein